MKIKKDHCSFSLGIDIGGTNIKMGIVKGNKIIKKKILKTEKDLPNKEFGKYLINAIRDFIKGYKIEKIGIGIAGYVDYQQGVLKFSPNLPQLKNFFLKNFINENLKIKTFVLNDADAAAIGEYFYHRKYRNLITLTLGTGVGSGIIINNKLIYNSEFGHTILIPNGFLCSCGKRGCVESYLGSSGILRFAENLYKRKIKGLTPKIIFKKAKAGDKIALAIIKKYGFYLGIALSNLANIFNPEIIILNGGLSNMGNLLLKFTKPVLKENTFYQPKVHISNLKTNAGIIGALNFDSFGGGG
uniref:ROK family protein n=1 Tax=candidate division WOR-3 bacterium TaxID=2052148 RepID=A0A7V3ZUV0_UNCW3